MNTLINETDIVHQAFTKKDLHYIIVMILVRHRTFPFLFLTRFYDNVRCRQMVCLPTAVW